VAESKEEFPRLPDDVISHNGTDVTSERHYLCVTSCRRRWHSADPAAKLLTEPSQMASPAEMARRYGPEMIVPDWRKRLVCSRCGGHDTGMVATGERR
jgi:hypothetical protein